MRALFLLALTALLCACSKDVRSTNKIHGSWQITSVTGLHTTSAVSGTMQFNKCDIIDDDYRAFRQDYTYQIEDSLISVAHTGSYGFEDEGKTLVVRLPAEPEARKYSVQQLDKKKVVITGLNSEHTGMTFTLVKD